MATVAEVKQRALELLGTPIGQSAESQHDTRIGTAYTEVYADLKEEGISIWAEAGTIPNRIAPFLIGLMAWNAIDDFGVSDSRYQRISNKVNLPNDTNGGRAKREIRRLVAQKYESLEEPTDY